MIYHNWQQCCNLKGKFVVVDKSTDDAAHISVSFIVVRLWKSLFIKCWYNCGKKQINSGLEWPAGPPKSTTLWPLWWPTSLSMRVQTTFKTTVNQVNGLDILPHQPNPTLDILCMNLKEAAWFVLDKNYIKW